MGVILIENIVIRRFQLFKVFSWNKLLLHAQVTKFWGVFMAEKNCTWSGCNVLRCPYRRTSPYDRMLQWFMLFYMVENALTCSGYKVLRCLMVINGITFSSYNYLRCYYCSKCSYILKLKWGVLMEEIVPIRVTPILVCYTDTSLTCLVNQCRVVLTVAGPST